MKIEGVDRVLFLENIHEYSWDDIDDSVVPRASKQLRSFLKSIIREVSNKNTYSEIRFHPWGLPPSSLEPAGFCPLCLSFFLFLQPSQRSLFSLCT